MCHRADKPYMNVFEGHPTLDDLEIFVTDKLPAGEVPEIAIHLSQCERCQKMSEELKNALRVLRGHPPNPMQLYGVVSRIFLYVFAL